MSGVYRVGVTLTMDYLLTSNQRPHWAVRHRKTKYMRGLAKDTAQALRVPALRRARIVAWVTWPDGRRRDRHNLSPTVKALVDGIVDAGVIPDDSDRYLDGPDTRTTDARTTPALGVIRLVRIELEITDLGGGGAPMPNHDYDRPARCDSCGGVINQHTGECRCSD